MTLVWMALALSGMAWGIWFLRRIIKEEKERRKKMDEFLGTFINIPDYGIGKNRLEIIADGGADTADVLLNGVSLASLLPISNVSYSLGGHNKDGQVVLKVHGFAAKLKLNIHGIQKDNISNE